MKPWPKWVWVVAGLILLVVGGCAIFLFILLMPSNTQDNQNPAKQAEMIALTLEWGRLAPFPQTAYNFSIHTEGNAFTRSFRASFNAPEEDLRQWLKESPGLQDATVTSMPEGKQKYRIQPGGGASHAEVTIDFKSGAVEVYVSWS